MALGSSWHPFLLEIPPFPAHRLLKTAGSRSGGPCPVRFYSGQGRRTRVPSRILMVRRAAAPRDPAEGLGASGLWELRDESRLSPRFFDLVRSLVRLTPSWPS